MTLTTTDLLDDDIRDDLDTIYAPGWIVSWTLAGHMEIMPGPARDWGNTTQAERVAWRDKLAKLWRRKSWMAA